MLPLSGGDSSCRAVRRLEEVFAADDSTGTDRPSGRSRNNSGYWCTGSLDDAAAAKQGSRSLSRQRRDRKPAGSTAPFAGGGKRSRCSSSAAPPPARSKPTTPPSGTSNARHAATATQPTTNRLFSLRRRSRCGHGHLNRRRFVYSGLELQAFKRGFASPPTFVRNDPGRHPAKSLNPVPDTSSGSGLAPVISSSTLRSNEFGVLNSRPYFVPQGESSGITQRRRRSLGARSRSKWPRKRFWSCPGAWKTR